MNLRRIFANAIARRVAYVVVVLVLAWVGIGDARAQHENCLNGEVPQATCANRQDAYNGVIAVQDALHNWGSHPERPEITGPHTGTAMCGTGAWTCYRSTYRTLSNQTVRRNWPTGADCPAGYFWDDVNKTCGQPCDGEPPITAGDAHAPGDAQAFCQGGCAYSCSGASLLLTIDGQLRTVCAGPWVTSAGATCSAGEPDPLTPVVDTDGDGISDDNDLSPNNPGESGDGSGQDGSKACGGPGQPECAPDGSNEGSGKGNTSGGGGDCNTPPRSSGDAILAQIAFQTWATRCAVTANANTKPGTGDGSGEGSEMDKLRGEAAGLDTSLGEGDADGAWIEGPTTLDLDTGGLGFGGSCPAPPTVDGQSIDPDGNLCMLVQIIGALVLVGAFAHAGYIIGRA